MQIIIQPRGRTVHDILSLVLQRIQNSGKMIEQTLLATTQNHFRTIYPGSKHYDPDNVTKAGSQNGTVASGTIHIAIPGITRAFHNMNISIVKRNNLTIPIHQESYGKRVRELHKHLIKITTKQGKEYLAEKIGDNLVFLYRLKKEVFQKQDRRLLPSEQEYADNVFSRLRAYMSATAVL